MRRSSVISLLLLLACLTACNRENSEERLRRAAEEVRQSITDVDAPALSQKLAPEKVREIQTALRSIHEYHGEITGELDSVTVNALQAFQRSRGLRDDGIVDEKTLAALSAR